MNMQILHVSTKSILQRVRPVISAWHPDFLLARSQNTLPLEVHVDVAELIDT
jgi:hypothetical protein